MLKCIMLTLNYMTHFSEAGTRHWIENFSAPNIDVTNVARSHWDAVAVRNNWLCLACSTQIG